MKARKWSTNSSTTTKAPRPERWSESSSVIWLESGRFSSEYRPHRLHGERQIIGRSAYRLPHRIPFYRYGSDSGRENRLPDQRSFQRERGAILSRPGDGGSRITRRAGWLRGGDRRRHRDPARKCRFASPDRFRGLARRLRGGHLRTGLPEYEASPGPDRGPAPDHPRTPGAAEAAL